MKFAVLGGDMRIAQMCAQLARDGQEVCAFALERGGLDAGVRQCSALTEACQGADCVVLPLPAAGQRGYLNTPLVHRGVQPPGGL